MKDGDIVELEVGYKLAKKVRDSAERLGISEEEFMAEAVEEFAISRGFAREVIKSRDEAGE